MPTPTLVVHYHIFKVGGTTITKSLRRRFRDGFVEIDKLKSTVGTPLNAEAIKRILVERPEMRACSAHRLVANVHLDASLDVFPITFLRHPLLRAASAWRFARARTDASEFADSAKSLALGEWLEWCLSPGQLIECRNYQSRVLSTRDDGTASHWLDGDVLRGDFDEAARRLAAMPMGCVGIVEEYDLSARAIEVAARDRGLELKIDSRPANATKVVDDWQAELAAVEAEIPRTVLDRFYEANADDLAMFERYRARLLAMPEHAAI